MQHVLYTGPGLAGVGTSLRYLAQVQRIDMREAGPTCELALFVDKLVVRSDVRTSYGFRDAVDGITRSRESMDPHLRSLGPHFQRHLEYLAIVDAVVFVADSQHERSEANAERLEVLGRDLRRAGRVPDQVRVVFQCNKQDLPNALTTAQVAQHLEWLDAYYLPSIAKTGIGVFQALRQAVSGLRAAGG